MSSTNKTTNYHLSQFLGTDKPAWLGDYNQDMAKIDTQMKLNDTAATAAQGTASAAANGLGDISELETTSKTSAVAAINELNTGVGTAQQTANTAAANATDALYEIGEISDYLNLNVFNLYDSAANFQAGTYLNYRSGQVRIARNDTNSMFKLYGMLTVNNTAGNTTPVTITIRNTGLMPSSSIVIESAGMATPFGGGDAAPIDLTIKNTGDIDITFKVPGANVNVIRCWFPPCIYFLKSFNDSGSPDA